MAAAKQQDQKDALNFPYMYGYPLIEFGKFVSSMPNAVPNKLYHGRRLTDSDDHKVIRPNVDTLYSTIFLDLSSKNLEVSVPVINHRYWCLAFYDPYGNNVVNISSLQSHKAGKYNVRFAESRFGLETPSLATDKSDDAVGCVDFPTAYGICLIRIAVIPDEADQKIATGYQDKLHVRQLDRPSGPIAPPLPMKLFSAPGYYQTASVPATEAVLNLTAALAQYNPPIVLQDRAWVSQTLHRSGIYSGVVRNNPLFDDSALRQFAESQSRQLLESPGGTLDHGNGWSSSYPDCMGLFHSNYAARYYIAKRGYLGLTEDQAIYPSLPGPLNIESNKAILVQFSRRPVLVDGGFWSLTSYDADQYLVPNEMRRYCLGDRDKIVFPDQTQVSDRRKDGKFYILLQAADNAPPSGWRSNWLPTPAGGGKMSITLRWYGATKEMTDGRYEYPKLIHIDAITDSNHPKL